MTLLRRILTSIKHPSISSVRMASQITANEPIHAEYLASFHAHLAKSKRILALCGAGLSAASGLPTFRGAGGLWRTHDAVELATPQAFNRDPGLVWQFYSYRRHMAMSVRPNKAHYALAEMARRHDGFLTLSQNVDGLSQRAKHPADKIKLLHGSLAEVKCTEFTCKYREENLTDPIIPLLEIPTSGQDPTSNASRAAVANTLAEKRGRELDISDETVEIPNLRFNDLLEGGLRCPSCRKGLLRPGVVWFGEQLPTAVLNSVAEFLNDDEPIDLVLVIGTSSKVYPAAGYVQDARDKGARVCTINMDFNDVPQGVFSDEDWFFKGDAAFVVPELLKPITGEVQVPENEELENFEVPAAS